MHLPHIIVDLALILCVAGITTLIFKKIKQPVILGYILAGILVGPHVSLLPTVTDSEGLSAWSEIGVIFFLFSLGLEFSFRKLITVGGAAIVATVMGIILVMGIGYGAGQAFGWSEMDSLFLGAILSISSTMIAVRSFDDLGLRTRNFVSVVMGVLIVQDVVAVLLMVLLSTVSATRQFEGMELLLQCLKLGLFLILWFVAGIFFVPTLIKRARALLNDETMLIVSLALCLGMVMLAVRVGFSAALGAFIMGSILAETTQAERIEHLVKPVRDLFTAVFFVSVGILFDPSIFKSQPWAVMLIVIITVVGKFAANVVGMLIAGRSLKHSVQAGASLSQIGEFSFIIASLGVTLNVTSSILYPIVVATAILTAFISPYAISKSTSLAGTIERLLPARWVGAIDRYSVTSQQLSAYGEWRQLLRDYAMNFVVHTVILVAMIILSRSVIRPWIFGVFQSSLPAAVITTVLTLVLMIPFIWALAIRRISRDAYTHLWFNRKINRGPLIALEVARVAVAILLISLVIRLYFTLFIASLIAVLAIALATFVFSKRLQSFYERMERRFFKNLTERDAGKIRSKEMAPWDAHLAELDVSVESPFVGRELAELQLREVFGINIALIERAGRIILAPNSMDKLFPGDRLFVIGTDEQLAKVKGLFEKPMSIDVDQPQPSEITLRNFSIYPHSKLCGQTIRSTGIKEKAKAIVVGLERNGERFLNPSSSMTFEEGDTVWIVGIRERLKTFLKQQKQVSQEITPADSTR